MKATGTFEVALSPLEASPLGAEGQVGRMSIDKTFAGDLEGASRGEMLTGGAPAEGSAGYVAIERFTGTLGGRSGAFQLQHTATMSPEGQESSIIVVPGSSSGELQGITGEFVIRIEGGQHFYDFEYSLP